MNLNDLDLFIVDDNLFTDEESSTIENYFVNDNFPWYLCNTLTTTVSKSVYDHFKKISKDIEENSQLYHMFVSKGKINSDLSITNFILEKIQAKYNIPLKVNRIKANFCPKVYTQNKNSYQTPHTDTSLKHLVIIYYVNNSDGDTFLFDQVVDKNIEDINQLTIKHRVSPKKGRFIIFHGDRLHSGMHPTNTNFRIVINFNILL